MACPDFESIAATIDTRAGKAKHHNPTQKYMAAAAAHPTANHAAPTRFRVVTTFVIMLNALVFMLESSGGNAFVTQWSAVPADIASGRSLVQAPAVV
jgi:membrane associated rhomboid family serine protease